MLGNPIPMELVTFLGSGLMSGILTIWNKAIESKKAMFEMAMARDEAQAKVLQEVRAAGSPGFQWTRRFIAVMVIFFVVCWPLIVPVFNDSISITLGWTEMQGGFWPFTDAKEMFVWKTIQTNNIVITPLMTHLASAICGFLYGNQIMKKL